MVIITYQGGNLTGSWKNAIINNVVDDILLNETQKVSSAREAPEFLDFDFDENNVYQVGKISLEETKEEIEWRKCVFEF